MLEKVTYEILAMKTSSDYPLGCKLKGVSALAGCPSLDVPTVCSRIHEGIVDLASNSIKEAPLAATHRISGPNVASFLLIAQILAVSFIKLQVSLVSYHWQPQPLPFPSHSLPI